METAGNRGDDPLFASTFSLFDRVRGRLFRSSVSRQCPRQPTNPVVQVSHPVTGPPRWNSLLTRRRLDRLVRGLAACQRDMERTTRTTKKEERLLLTIIATTRLQSRLVFSVGSGDNVSFAERAVHGQLPAGCMYVHISARGFSPRSSLSPSNPRLETHLEGHPGRATSGCGSTRLPSD